MADQQARRALRFGFRGGNGCGVAGRGSADLRAAIPATSR
jgi:hypothetical protein